MNFDFYGASIGNASKPAWFTHKPFLQNMPHEMRVDKMQESDYEILTSHTNIIIILIVEQVTVP